MQAITEEILSLVSKAFGANFVLSAEEVETDGQLLISWRRPRSGPHLPLRAEPSILVSADGQTLRWTRALGYPERPFTRSDLADADPSNEGNRDPRTRGLAELLRGLLTADLMSLSGSCALVAALRELNLWHYSAVALVASATQCDSWEIRRLEDSVWSGPSARGTHKIVPPHAAEAFAAARRVTASETLQSALGEGSRALAGGLRFLPVVRNCASGLHCAGL